MKRFLKNLFGFTSPGTPEDGPPDRRARLGLEALDRRDQPAYVSLDGSGLLLIRGETFGGRSWDDRVTIRESDVAITVTSNRPAWGWLTNSFSRAAVSQVVFEGYAGDDVFDNVTSIPSEAYGGSGNDTLWGGFSDDSLFGGDDDDRVYGFEGYDLLMGDHGDDWVSGGDDGDSVYGDTYDTATGAYSGTGRDWLFGGADSDYLHGGAGDDHLDGGYDGLRDVLIGGAGADTFVTHRSWVGGSLPGLPPVYYPQDEFELNWDFDSAAGDVIEYLEH